VRSTVAGVSASAACWKLPDQRARCSCRHWASTPAGRRAAGEVPGPRFQTTGHPLAGTVSPGPGAATLTMAPTPCCKACARSARRANWIKVSVSDGRWRDTRLAGHSLISPDEMQAVVQEARRKDLRVACHVDGPLGARLAVEAGVDSIEHGVHIPPNLLDQMAEHGIFFVPHRVDLQHPGLKVSAPIWLSSTTCTPRPSAAPVRWSENRAGVDYAFIQADGHRNKRSLPPWSLVV